MEWELEQVSKNQFSAKKVRGSGTCPAPCSQDIIQELVNALKWAMAKEPSPCRCVEFATPPHVCTAHRAIAKAEEFLANSGGETPSVAKNER